MPFIVIVFLFSYVPIFGWIYSFFDYVPGVSIFNCDFVGLDYFKLIFRDDNVLRSLKNTFIFAIINICLTPLPMFMAILLNELRNGPIKKFTQTFTTLPNFISWVIIFSLATALFASDGIVTGLATAMGLGDASNSLLGSNEAVYWFQSFLLQWKTLGWNSIIYMAAISGIDQEQYEAARVDGASSFCIFRKIILPLILPGIAAVAMFVLFNGWNEYMYSSVLVSKDSLKTLTVGIVALNSQYQIKWNDLMAASTVSSLPLVILFVCFQKYFIAGMTGGAVKS